MWCCPAGADMVEGCSNRRTSTSFEIVDRSGATIVGVVATDGFTASDSPPPRNCPDPSYVARLLAARGSLPSPRPAETSADAEVAKATRFVQVLEVGLT